MKMKTGQPANETVIYNYTSYCRIRGAMQLTSLLLKNGRVIDPAAGIDEIRDIFVVDGRIAAGGAEGVQPETAVIDCSGLWVVPGLIDVHCHLREPGGEHKETIATGTQAAARGGFTTVVAMANVNPAPDSVHEYHKIRKLIGDKAVVNVIQAASVTKDLRGRDLCDMTALTGAGVTVFTDDGHFIDRAAVLYQALQLSEKLNVTLALHEEDSTLRLYDPMAYHPLNETVAIARDLEVMRVAGGNVHFQHISTARSVELIRQAKREKLNVTAEVCPHHLTLTKKIIEKFGTHAKMAPPLRTEEDVAELLKGLDDGTIDLIATDHAPHAADDKLPPFDTAANGIVGFETALPVLLTHLIHEQGRQPSWLIERMSAIPGRLFGLSGGKLSLGEAADVCIIDPNKEWMIDRKNFASKGRNTPYHGAQVKGAVTLTIVNGRIVFDGRGESGIH